MISHWAISALTTLLSLFLWKKMGIKDNPSHRSSHANATPTAAGICFSLVLISFYLFDHTLTPTPHTFIIGLLTLAAVGFIDDWHELSYKTRLVSHVFAVGLVLSCQTLTPLEYAIWFFIGVGLINACNFLDGINGLLASQWLLTTGFLLAAFANPNSIFWILWISVLIYLFFNFPKSHIFMGDTGSTILGFSYFAIIFYQTPLQNNFPGFFIAKDSFILFCLFPLAFAWGDVTFTLSKRFIEKRSIISSFGDYGFHHQARFFKSHSIVTLKYLCLNCLLVYMAQFLFLNHQYIYSICIIYIALQITLLFLVQKIARSV